MARIDISEPYVSFLESQVKAGLFNTISEAARDAIRKQMDAYEMRRVASIQTELSKGEASILAGKTVQYTEDLMAEISQAGKDNAIRHKPVRDEIKP